MTNDDTVTWSEHLESREMLTARLEACQEQVDKLEAMLGRFGEQGVPTSERPYVIRVTIYGNVAYDRIFKLISNVVPDGLDLVVSGQFETEERNDDDDQT